MAKYVEAVIVMKYPFHEDMEMEDYKGGFVEDIGEMSDVELLNLTMVEVVDE